MPSRSTTPGRNPSSTTSALCARSLKVSTPRPAFKSIATDRLPRLSAAKCPLNPLIAFPLAILLRVVVGGRGRLAELLIELLAELALSAPCIGGGVSPPLGVVQQGAFTPDDILHANLDYTCYSLERTEAREILARAAA